MRKLFLLASTSLIAGQAVAGEFNYKNLLTGERAAGLGGAYVALADDNTGMFYNPAGMVHSKEKGATAALNLVTSTNTEYENVFGENSYKRESLEIVPGFIGSMAKLNKWKIGYSIVVVDSLNEDQSDLFENVTIGNDPQYDNLYVRNDYSARTYNMGLSFAHPLSDAWSWGSSLYVHYRDKEASLLQRLSRDTAGNAALDDDAILVSANTEDTELGIKPVLGLMYRDSRMSFGISASRAYPFNRDYTYTFIGDAQSAGGGAAALSFQDTSEDALNGPWQGSLAVALFSEGGVITTLQVDYISEREAQASAAPNLIPARDLNTEAVVNAALGLEIPWGGAWLGRVGLYTNFANNKVEEAGAVERREEIDMYGATFSVSRYTEQSNWTVGLQFAGGSGEATLGDIGFGTSAASGAPVDATRQRFNIFVSTTL